MKTKRLILILLCVVLSATVIFSATACNNTVDEDALRKKYADNIAEEMEGCFNFFWEQTETQNSITYGLTLDRWPSAKTYASIASVGYALSAYVIGVKYGYVTKEEAEERCLKTLQTIDRLQQKTDVSYAGFLAHFINLSDGSRSGNCEISSVDTAILLCGAIHAGQYFGGAVQEAANKVYSNVDFNKFVLKRGSKEYISMAYYPQTGKLSSGCWDWYAEQLMLYVVGAGSPVEEHRLTDKTYYDFTRKSASYGIGNKFIYSYFGSVFTYQFSHAWIDFRGIVDANGTDWYQNSVDASIAAYEFCQDNRYDCETFADGAWGLTACDVPNGYSGLLGNPPRGNDNVEEEKYKQTIASAGALGSVVFTPKESLEALEYYQSLRMLNGKYGLNDSFNLDYNWYAADCLGIDKGITLLMLANFMGEDVWEDVMQNEYVNNGLDVLGFMEA